MVLQSTSRSLALFYARAAQLAPTLLVLRTATQAVFGAYVTAPFGIGNYDGEHTTSDMAYGGTGESFVFSTAPYQRFAWTGVCVPLCDPVSMHPQTYCSWILSHTRCYVIGPAKNIVSQRVPEFGDMQSEFSCNPVNNLHLYIY